MRRLFKVTVSALTIIMAMVFMPLTAKAELLSYDDPAAVTYYNMIPDNIKAKMNNAGVHIAVNSDMVSMRSNSGRAVGITATTYRPGGQIVSQAIYVKYGYEDAILHEVGHFMSSYPNTIEFWTNNPTWNNIYCSEVCNATAAGLSNANIYNASEYFAEAFQVYILNPGALATYCPQTYQYINILATAP